MGRSKFPGKPPKTATRKRIKVLGQPEVAQNDPVTVAENIYYGLSLFNETFGDNEKVREKTAASERPPSSPAVVTVVIAVAVDVAVADEASREAIVTASRRRTTRRDATRPAAATRSRVLSRRGRIR